MPLAEFGTFFYEQLFETPVWKPSSPTLLAGRTAIVTGSNSGIGFEAAVHLAGLDPKLLIIAVRSISRGEAAKAELVKRTGIDAGRVEVWALDLSSFDSVKSFAARVNKLGRLDILLENAGIQFTSWKETDDQWEQVLQVNGISTGLLGVLLLPLLAKTATLPLRAGQKEIKPHLTIVGSEVHGFASPSVFPRGTSLLADLNDPSGTNSNPKHRYGFSKLINLFLARKISALPAAKGVVVNVVNPGLCVSGLADQMKIPGPLKAIMYKASRTAESGARNLAWAAENDTPPGAYVSVTSVRSSSAWSRSEVGLKMEVELWAELVDEWVKIEPSVSFFYEQLFETPKWQPASATLLTGRTVIVTGSNAGLGYEAAIKLATLHPKLLILAVRSLSKGEEAKADLIKRSGIAPERVEVWELDLTSFDSVKRFADRAGKLDRLDILCENAGVASKVWDVTVDGWERVLQVNAISTGLLGVLLLPLLAKTATMPLEEGQSEFKPHLTIVGSEVHGFTSFAPVPTDTSLLADLNNQHGNNSGQRYELTKLIDVFLARKIAALPMSKGVIVNVVNPGMCVSGLVDAMGIARPVRALLNAASRTPESGARNLAWACVNDTPPGAYVSVTSVREPSEYSKTSKAMKIESDLWTELIEEWIKIDPGVRVIVA